MKNQHDTWILCMGSVRLSCNEHLCTQRAGSPHQTELSKEVD